ncbi:MAG: fumarylpyruvate hydrolase NagK [Rhodobacteraceae bacterium HLUCCA08]|nr:MAG: fumarylpyruvate hydrolase NagK [Rhodobacteraceae bacterium HLUCCA08]
MTDLLFPLPQPFSLPVQGQTARYPLFRIFCVGRNYAAHAAEMGQEVDREAPFYFTKSVAHAVGSGTTQPYPSRTDNYHFEMEFAVTLGAEAWQLSEDRAMEAVHGYCCALDMTRRDLQGQAKDRGRPWDTGKDVEGSAVFGPVTAAAAFGPIDGQRIRLSVNGAVRQDGTLAELIHSVPAIIADLSGLYHLRPGDVIMTGTPAGVGPVRPGDVLEGSVDGLDPVHLTIGEPA